VAFRLERQKNGRWTRGQPELEAMYGPGRPGGFFREHFVPGRNLIHSPIDRPDAAARIKHALETFLPTEGELAA